MRSISSRCKNCLDIYNYHLSGLNNLNNTNNSIYCPNCMAIALDAMSKLPKKCEMVWEEDNNITAEELLQHEEKIKKAIEKSGELYGRKTIDPLYDFADPENIYLGTIIKYDNIIYLVETWSKTPEKNKVKVALEREMATDKRRFWRDFGNSQ